MFYTFIKKGLFGNTFLKSPSLKCRTLYYLFYFTIMQCKGQFIFNGFTMINSDEIIKEIYGCYRINVEKIWGN